MTLDDAMSWLQLACGLNFGWQGFSGVLQQRLLDCRSLVARIETLRASDTDLNAFLKSVEQIAPSRLGQSCRKSPDEILAENTYPAFLTILGALGWLCLALSLFFLARGTFDPDRVLSVGEQAIVLALVFPPCVAIAYYSYVANRIENDINMSLGGWFGAVTGRQRLNNPVIQGA